MEKLCRCDLCIAENPNGCTFQPSAFKAHRAKVAALNRTKKDTGVGDVEDVAASLQQMELSKQMVDNNVASSQHSPSSDVGNVMVSFTQMTLSGLPADSPDTVCPEPTETSVPQSHKQERHVGTKNTLERFRQMGIRMDTYQAKLQTSLTAEEVSDIENGVAMLRSALEASRRRTSALDEAKGQLAIRLNLLEERLMVVRSGMPRVMSPVHYDTSKGYQ